MDECIHQPDQELNDEIFWEPRKKVKGIRIEEQKFGDYECLEIILSLKKENHILMPWKNGVIVKMLRRCVGFKALETILQQL